MTIMNWFTLLFSDSLCFTLLYSVIGVNSSANGYLFTITNTRSDKIIECSCADANPRDVCVNAIRDAFF